MKHMLFLLRKTVKNWLLEAIRHPGRLVIYIILIALILFGSFGNAEMSEDMSAAVDISILHGAYFVILIIAGVVALGTALQSGTSIFTMSDVNLLFVSPISAKSILAFGLFKQMGVFVLLFFFLTLYGGMLRSLFAITGLQAVVLISVFLVYMLFCQMLAMAIYSFANSNSKRIAAIKTALYVCAALPIVIIAAQTALNGFSLASLYSALKSPVAEAIPLFGWLKGLAFALFDGTAVKACVYGLLTAASIAAVLLYFVYCQPDYYEDVLQNTESTFEMRQALKQGKVVDKRDFSNNRKISLRGVGIGGGKGASAFFFKHLREIRRRSRLIFFNIFSFIQLGINIFMAVFLKNIDDAEPMPVFAILISLLAMGTYLQMFFSAAGEWGRELLKPYIYLVPDSPLKKLFFASLTSIIKPFFDGVLAFAAVGIYLGANPLDIIMCILAYSSLGAIFAGANILSERIVSGLNIRTLTMMLYILMSIIIILPGIAAAVITGLVIGDAVLYICLVPLIICNLAMSFLLFFLSKNTIHNMETNL